MLEATSLRRSNFLTLLTGMNNYFEWNIILNVQRDQPWTKQHYSNNNKNSDNNLKQPKHLHYYFNCGQLLQP